MPSRPICYLRADQCRKPRVEQRVLRIGRIGGKTYYASRRSEAARNFLHIGRLKRRWKSLRAAKEIQEIEECSSPCIAYGRALLLTQQLGRVRARLEEVKMQDFLYPADWERLGRLVVQTRRAQKKVEKWLIDNANGVTEYGLPEVVDEAVPGWTAAELQEVLRPHYAKTEKVSRANKLVPLLERRIRRVRNPEYKIRFSPEPQRAAEFLFDKTSALIYASTTSGGVEARFQASVALQELGPLRDVRFVLPGIESKESDMRLATVSCLAFLTEHREHERLLAVATSDPEPGVREAALWAYGFLGGADAWEVIMERVRSDEHPEVRRFAEECLQATEETWWKV